MKFEDAIVQSITQFYEGKLPDSLNELAEDGLTYTPEWFDAFEETIQNGEALKDTPTKPKKGKKTPPVEPEIEMRGLGHAKQHREII